MIGENERIMSEEEILVDMLGNVVAGVHRSCNNQDNLKQDKYSPLACLCSSILWTRQAGRERLGIVHSTARVMELDTPKFDAVLEKAYLDINEDTMNALRYVLKDNKVEKKLLPYRRKNATR